MAAGLALALTLAACGDSSGPGTFDPAATSADLAAMQAPLSSPVMASFGFALNGVADAGGPEAGIAAWSGGCRQGPRALSAAAMDYARALVGALPSRPAGLALAGPIPDSLLGTTWTYDDTQGRYVVSARTDGPSNGVRFVLYAVNPVTSSPPCR